MLQSLHVKNLALIDEVEVTFGEGLNILTGETGAGKSILIGSINLALGAKADKELIREGADYALVELIFELDNELQIEQIRQMDLPIEDGQIILQRKIMPARNVCKVCGEAVSARQIKQLAGILIDIHGQHEHQSLLQSARQLEILDAYAGDILEKKKDALRECYAMYREAVSEWEEHGTDEETRKREAALAEFECREIEEAELTAGEDEKLEKLYQKLVNSQKIKEAATAAYGYCSDGESGAGALIGRALREIKAAAAYDEKLAEYEQQLLDIDNLVNDCNRGLAEYLADLEFDGELFDKTEKRLDLLNHLKSKYGDSVEKILEYQQRSQALLYKMQDYDTYRANLKKRMEELKQEVSVLCEELSQIRRECAEELAVRMKKALLDLNFQNTEFEIKIESAEEFLSAKGYDRIAFLISTNVGEKPKELAQIASGGELSRIMLALKTVLADKDAIETLIFDEIDTGISGKTAWKVSEKMGILAESHQLICITHLPQIAAMADQHFCIEKQVAEGRAVTDIHRLTEEESVEELARMLGGASITEAVRSNAREMKELARKSK